MYKLCLLLLVPGICLTFLCCHKQGTTPTATIEVIYACNPPLRPTTASYAAVMTIAVNGNVLVGMGGTVAAANVMDITIPAANEDLTFSIQSSTADTVFAEWKINAAAHQHYNAFFGGPATNPCKVFFQDQLPTADPTKALVRFIDLSSDSFSFTCYYNDTVITTGLNYQQVTPFVAVTPHYAAADSAIAMKLVNTADTSITTSLKNLDLVPGGIYSIIVCGNHNSAAMGLTLYKYYNNHPTPL